LVSGGAGIPVSKSAGKSSGNFDGVTRNLIRYPRWFSEISLSGRLDNRLGDKRLVF
jgi:hypothetical protein